METNNTLETFLNITLDVNEWSHMNKGKYSNIFSSASTKIFVTSGALIVVTDMSLAMISVLFNLMVITSIRRKEEILSVTFNMVRELCQEGYKVINTICFNKHKPPHCLKFNIKYNLSLLSPSQCM